MHDTSRMTHRERWWLAGALLLALVVRVVATMQARALNPDFYAPQMDALFHVEWARALANGTEYLDPAERKSYLASAQSIRSAMNLEALKAQLEKLIDDRTPLDVGTLAGEPAPDKPGAE